MLKNRDKLLMFLCFYLNAELIKSDSVCEFTQSGKFAYLLFLFIEASNLLKS